MAGTSLRRRLCCTGAPNVPNDEGAQTIFRCAAAARLHGAMHRSDKANAHSKRRQRREGFVPANPFREPRTTADRDPHANLSPMSRLEFSGRLARDAGRLAHTAFGQSATSMKGRHDVLTAMDGEVERFIRKAIAATLSGRCDHRRGGRRPRRRDRVWLIDPIDGTANYARGIPHYCVSIGYLEHGVPTVAAMHDPSHDWLYSAARGEGAWRDGQRLAVSACDDLGAATVECGWSTRRSTADYLALLTRVMDAGCAIRRVGSGALGLADVAAGRSEAYCEMHINAVGLRGGHPARAGSGRLH